MKVPQAVADMLEQGGHLVPAEVDSGVVNALRHSLGHAAYSHLTEAEATNLAIYMAASRAKTPLRKQTDPRRDRLVDPRLCSRIDAAEAQIVVLTTEIIPKLRSDITEEILQLKSTVDGDLAGCAKNDEFSAVTEALLRRINQLEARLHRQLEWIDTFSAPLYKRIWWWLCGWRWKTLGRWRGRDTTKWPPASR